MRSRARILCGCSGVEYPQQRLVNYDLCRAIPIFEGKVDKENESEQEPVQATSGAENI